MEDRHADGNEALRKQGISLNGLNPEQPFRSIFIDCYPLSEASSSYQNPWSSVCVSWRNISSPLQSPALFAVLNSARLSGLPRTSVTKIMQRLWSSFRQTSQKTVTTYHSGFFEAQERPKTVASFWCSYQIQWLLNFHCKLSFLAVVHWQW